MANNVPITAGTGTTVATDQLADLSHVQLIKLLDGTEDSTARIGGDAANGLDVDVTRVIPGTSATHLGKAEDAVHASGDTGVMALGVRADTAASTAANGDYVPFITDSSGRVWVNVGAVGSGAADLAKLEDAASASGDAGVMVLSVRRDAAVTSSGTDGDYSTLNTDATGRLWARSAAMGGWTANHAPAAAAQATITKAAAGAGIKNVCTSISVSLSSAAAPTVGVVTFNLRDGATGAGTILWTLKLSLPAVAGQSISESIPVWIEGTANTAMTLETAAAPAANVQATVAMTGTTI